MLRTLGSSNLLQPIRQTRCCVIEFSTSSAAAARLHPGFSLKNVGPPKSPVSAVKAITPEEPPVYLTMCSLLHKKPGDIPAEEKVVALDRSVFAHPIRRDILHLCVIFYRDNIRQGTASTKTRGEVAGSRRKIRPQKGTGRARLGDRQSPMLRGGGRAFGPKPRDFSTDLPRKVRQMGMRVALSEKVREDAFGVAETLQWTGVKTKAFAQRINGLGWTNTLFVTGAEQVPPMLERASRNVPKVALKRAMDLEVYDLLKWHRVVMDVQAVDYFERLLGKNVAQEERIPPPRRQHLRFSRMIAGRTTKGSPKIPGVDVGRQKGKSVDSAHLFEEVTAESTSTTHV